MKCKKVQKYIPLYVGRDLPDRTIKDVALHLVECELCHEQMASFQHSNQVLKDLGNQTLTFPALSALQKSVREKVHRQGLLGNPQKFGRPSSFTWPIGITAAASLLVIVSAFLHYQYKGGSTYIERQTASSPPSSISSKIEFSKTTLISQPIVHKNTKSDPDFQDPILSNEVGRVETVYPLERVSKQLNVRFMPNHYDRYPSRVIERSNELKALRNSRGVRARLIHF